MSVTSSSASGTVMSYSAQIDSNPILTVYAESDGAGGIKNSAVNIAHSDTETAAATEYGINNTFSDTGVVTTGTDASYGFYNSFTRTGATGGTLNNYANYTALTGTFASGSGTINSYGNYITVAGNTNGTSALYGVSVNTTANADTTYGLNIASTGATTGTVYGSYISNGVTNTTTDAIDKYGIYVTSTGSFTGSTGTATNNYGLYLATTSGGDNNYQIYDQSGAYLSTAGTWTNAPSYRRYKGNYASTASYLDRLMTLDVFEWQYRNELIDGLNRYKDDPHRHASPFLDDFYETFGLGTPSGYNIQDLAGVAIASIKELNSRFIQQSQTDLTDISGVAFKTDENATTLSELKESIDGQLTLVAEQFDSFGNRVSTLETTSAEYESRIVADEKTVAGFESRLATLEETNNALLGFYNTFELGHLIAKDADGNLDLSNGKIRAKELSTGALAIEIVDEEAPTIGSATLFPKAVDKKGAKDADGNDIPDGIDDISGESTSDASVAARDGKSITVKTKAVSSGSRIFLTPKQATAEPLAVTSIVEGVGFTVEMKNETSEEIPFDWIVVEEK